MSVTQYTGARYVPLFADPEDWTNERTYEPLTIVLHEGNSFTSKQFVPKGIELTNEDFWAETGNYNAQVEQYRRTVLDYKDEVETFNDRINENALAIDNLQKLENPMAIRVSRGDSGATLVSYQETNVLIDCGGANDNLTAFLLKHLGPNKLDAVIVTHMHSDHVGAFNQVVPFINASTTPVYVQMAPPISVTSLYSQYLQALNTIQDLANNVLVPENNKVVEIGDLELRMFNTDSDNSEFFATIPGNNGTPPNDLPTLNNYSIITEVKCEGGSFLHTGDVEGVAQEYNARYVKPVDVCFLPHHRSNWNGYFQFFRNAMPKVFNIAARPATSSDISSPATYHHYNGRLLHYLGIPCIDNSEKDSAIKLVNNSIVECEGAYIPPSYTVLELGVTINAALSPRWYNRDPYRLWKMTLQEFATTGSANFFSYPTEFRTTSAEQMQFHVDACELLGVASTATLRWKLYGGWFEVQQAAYLTNKKLVVFWGSYNAETGAGYRIESLVSSAVRIALDNPAPTYTIPQGIDYDKMLNAEFNFIELSNGAQIPMQKVSSTTHRGVSPDGSGQYIYLGVRSSRSLTCKRITIATGEIIDSNIHAYGSR